MTVLGRPGLCSAWLCSALGLASLPGLALLFCGRCFPPAAFVPRSAGSSSLGSCFASARGCSEEGCSWRRASLPGACRLQRPLGRCWLAARWSPDPVALVFGARSSCSRSACKASSKRSAMRVKCDMSAVCWEPSRPRVCMECKRWHYQGGHVCKCGMRMHGKHYQLRDRAEKHARCGTKDPRPSYSYNGNRGAS